MLYGLPQGLMLAPILFIMYLNDMLALDIESEITSFADDAAMFFTVNFWGQIQDTVKKELKIVKDWFDENLL